MKLFQNTYLYESRGSLRLVQVWLSARSLGQILERSCVHSEGHNFDLIFVLPERNPYFVCPSIHPSHFCPEHISKSIEGNLMKLDTLIEGHEEHCRKQEP